MEYDYEFMWDYEISVHDDLDENAHAHTQNSTRIMQDEKAQTFRHLHICIMLAESCALDYDTQTHAHNKTLDVCVTDYTAHYKILAQKRAKKQGSCDS